ncbi:MAG TPA: dihydrolipoamide acetyltransferase family protein [Actinomycetota bacterium]|nr:dihydrolipoamide acetyltransferase family protein [Actinomycetota bacterium]
MTTIQMPQLGETIVEGTILKWLKREGEEIERDEPLFEISTDKVDTEVPSPVSGTVSKILVEEGQTVPVGTDLAEVSENGQAAGGTGDAGAAAGAPREPAAAEATPQEKPAAVEAAPQPAASAESQQAVAEGSAAEMPAAEPATPQGAAASAAAQAPSGPGPAGSDGALPDRGPRSRILSPLVRRLADEHGLDLSQFEGTGTGGRITKKDVLAAIESGGAAAAAAPATAEVPTAAPPAAPAPAPAARAAPAAPPPAAAPTAAPAPAAVAQPGAVGQGEEVVPISHIRKAIGQHMLASLQTSARAWTMVEVNVDHLVKLRERAKEAFKAKYGVNLTYLPFVIRATCDALLTHPEVNAELRGDEIVLHRFVNMGIAVSYDAGLIVPVIKGADAMNTVGLARAITDLADRARAHQLKPDEVHGATFTITNPGPYGSIASVPIINQPNAGILSLDAIQKRAVVIDDTIAIRSMVNISMSWDHRTIDGEIATRFLARVKQNLESWDFAEDVAV